MCSVRPIVPREKKKECRVRWAELAHAGPNEEPLRIAMGRCPSHIPALVEEEPANQTLAFAVVPARLTDPAAFWGVGLQLLSSAVSSKLNFLDSKTKRSIFGTASWPLASKMNYVSKIYFDSLYSKSTSALVIH